MATIIDYAENCKDSISENGCQTQDALVFAQLSYIEWEHILELSDEEIQKTLGPGYDKATVTRLLYSGGNEGLTLEQAISLYLVTEQGQKLEKSDDNYKLLLAVLNNPRFRNVILGNYEFGHRKKKTGEQISTETVLQYAAMTFIYTNENGEQEVFIGHRGTEAPLEGWAEDFLMAYETETWAQQCSLEYVERVAKIVDGKIRMGGHSKGGNEAKYAFLFCSEEVASRIIALYSFDGPGFNPGVTYHGETFDSVRWKEMEDLLKGHSVAPYDSVIGNLLEEQEFEYVKTNPDIGIFRDHDPYSWQLKEDYSFDTCDQAPISKYLDEAIDEAMSHMSYMERRSFILLVWNWLYSLKPKDFDDVPNKLTEDPWNALLQFSRETRDLNPMERAALDLAVIKVLMCLTDLGLKDITGYDQVKEAMFTYLKERNIHSFEEFFNYIKEDPLTNLLDLYQALIIDLSELPDLCLKLISITAVENLAKTLVLVLFRGIACLNQLIASIDKLISDIIAFVAIARSVLEWCVEAVKTIAHYVKLGLDFAGEKIYEFVESAKHKITVKANQYVADVMCAVDQISGAAEYLVDAGRTSINLIQKSATFSVKAGLAMTSPVLYTIARAISGAGQSKVTVDMQRLSNAVDQMELLAGQVQNMDRRLDRLYVRLAENNIEQGEGIITSLINLYNLCKADILVDQGSTIRRKANNIRATFGEYNDVERWVLSMLG